MPDQLFSVTLFVFVARCELKQLKHVGLFREIIFLITR